MLGAAASTHVYTPCISRNVHNSLFCWRVENYSLIKDNFIIVCYLIVASRLSALAFIQLHNCFNKWGSVSLLSG